jgi:hypothetical protein
VVTDCGAGCITYHNLSNQGTGKALKKVGDQWISDFSTIDHSVQCGPTDWRPSVVRTILNADLTKGFTDAQPIDCGAGPQKPAAAMWDMAREP